MRDAQGQMAAWASWPGPDPDSLKTRGAQASSWLERQAQATGSQIVVQAAAHAEECRHRRDDIGRLARHHSVATYRSPVIGGAATFVDIPDIQMLAVAMGTADGRPIVATESPTLPLRGWAMAMGALDLTTGDVTIEERTSEQITLLEELVGGLYNGWSHESGRLSTRTLLPKLLASGMTYEVFVGSLLAIAPRRLASHQDSQKMLNALPPPWRAQHRSSVDNRRFFLNRVD